MREKRRNEAEKGESKKQSGRSHFSLDAKVGFNKNVVSNLAQLLTGWAVLISSSRMKANNTAIWKRLPQLQELQLPTCLEVWSGDHRQTPGGLKKSQEVKAFKETHQTPIGSSVPN